MSEAKRCKMGVVAGLLLLVLVGTQSAEAAPEDDCNARLIVELTPDVADASDVGFLSSLLSNHPTYRLQLLRQLDPSLVELQLSGPGPGYLCLNAIQAMRRDNRILSVHIDPEESHSTLSASAPARRPELWGVPVSGSGIGSLYSAAHDPKHAWKVLLPDAE